MDEDLLARLPHRPPFLLLDRVLLLEPGAWAAAVKEIAAEGDRFTDEAGSWPPVLLAEAMAQTAGLAAAPPGGDGAAVLASIDRFRCRGGVRAGDRLLLTARVVRAFGATVLVRTAARAGWGRCAAAEIVLRFG